MSQAISKSLPSLFLWQFISVVVGLLTQVLLARTLGPHDKGILDLFLLIPVVGGSIAEFGLLTSNTYFAGKGTYSLPSLHANSVLWSLCAGIVLLFVAFAVSLGIASPFPSLNSEMFLLAIAAIAPSIYSSLWSGLMYGSDRAGKVYAVAAITSLINLVAYGIALVAGVPLKTLLILSGILLFIRAFISFFSVRTQAAVPFQPDLKALRQSFRYGAALYIGLALNTLHFRFVQFLVESMLGPAELGNFALAARIAEMVWLLDFVVINASVFRITSSDQEESIRITQRMTRMIGLAVSGMSLLIALSAPFIVPWVFGADFTPAVLPLILLLPGIVGWSLARSLAQFVAYHQGRPWYNTAGAAVAFALNLALNFLLIPTLGIAGAAIASSISYISNLVFLAVVFRKLSGAKTLPTFIPQREDFALLRQLLTDSLRPLLGRKG